MRGSARYLHCSRSAPAPTQPLPERPGYRAAPSHRARCAAGGEGRGAEGSGAEVPSGTAGGAGLRAGLGGAVRWALLVLQRAGHRLV